MKIDLTKTFEKPDGTKYLEPHLDENGNQIINNGEPQWLGETTLADVMKAALLSTPNPTNPDAKELTGKQKYQRWDLVKRINDELKRSQIINLESSEIAFVKEIIGKVFQTIIVGQAWDYLEGK